MPRHVASRSHRRRRSQSFLRILPPILAAALASLVVAGGSSAATLNTAQLDTGICGRSLQLGSDRTASSSATPSFVIAGDGGLSRYAAFVDGAPLGTFASDGFANVCVYDTIPLADGPHVLTANELQPHSTFTVVPFNFTVDTLPPAQPSTPVIATWSDSGLQGDHVTRFRSPNFGGFADPNVSIQLYSGLALLGGAKADANGAWSATTTALSDGSYTITAIALDQAGNKSQLSLSSPLTVDTVAPTGGLTNPTDGSVVSGTVSLAASGTDKNGIWKVDFQVDGVTKATSTASPFGDSWNTNTVSNGTHTLTTVVHDYADNTTTSTITVNVQNGVFTPTVPATPSVSGVVAGDRSVSLSWSAPADGGSPLTGYKLYRSTTSGAETLVATLGTATTYTDTGLVNGATYYYKLAATNAVGDSALSAERTATPFGRPASPALGSATAGNAQVTLNWSAPSDNGGSPLTGYKLYRGTSSGAETLLATLGTATTYTDTGLTNGNTYFYKLAAANAAGDSALSNEVSAIPATTPTRADVEARDHRRRHGQPELERAGQRRRRSHRLQDLPRHDERRRDSAHDRRRADELDRHRPRERDDLLLQGHRTQQRRRRPALQRALRDTRVHADRARRADAQPGHRRQRHRRAHLERTRLRRRHANHQLPDLPRHLQRRRDPPHHHRQHHQLQRHRSRQRHRLLLRRRRHQRRRPGHVLQRTLRHTRDSPRRADAQPGHRRQRHRRAHLERTRHERRHANHQLHGSTAAPPAAARPSSPPSATPPATTTPQSTTAPPTTTSSPPSTPQARACSPTNAPATPVTVPVAPTLNPATAGNGTVALTWNAPATNGGTPITNYRIYRGTSAAARHSSPPRQRRPATTTPRPRQRHAYYYGSPRTTPSATAVLRRAHRDSATTPGTPTLNPATAGDGTVASTGTHPPSDGGAAVSGYKIYRGTSSGGETLLTTLDTATGYVDSGLANGTTYYYRVSATNRAGEGDVSTERSATPGTVPGAPALNAADAGDGSVTLRWSAPASNGGFPVAAYNVYRGTASGGETLLTTLGSTSYVDTGAANGTTYYYRVGALNSLGEGAPSNELSATPVAAPVVNAPDAPSLDSATATRPVLLSWRPGASDGGSPLTGYRVYRGTASGGETLLASLGSQTSYSDDSAAYGTTYYYRVTAVNAVGESAPSSELSATPVAPDTVAPSKPGTPKALVVGTSQVALNWTASTDNTRVTGYRIYRDGTLVATAPTTYFLDSGLAAASTHTYTVRGIDAAGNQSVVSSSLRTKAASLSTGSTGTLSGVVFNAAGKLVSGATVSLRLSSGTVKSTTSSTSGVWKLSSLPPGQYALTATLAGLPPQTFMLTAAAGRTWLALVALDYPALSSAELPSLATRRIY